MRASFNNLDFSRDNFKGIVEGDWNEEDSNQIIIPVGETDDGFLYGDFDKIPNLIVSGTTGSGKSAFVRMLILEMMYKYSPDKVKFIIYDSKRVDYRLYESCPHLLVPIVRDEGKALSAINWLNSEAQVRLDRYDKINDMNHIFMIFDDYSEVTAYRDDVTDNLVQLFQVSRSTKIHCFIITSMPTSSVISTRLKVNIPTRITFHTTSKSISRSIIDANGAETLKLPGEMLIKENNDTSRCEALFLSDEDMEALCSDIIDRYPEIYHEHTEIETQENKTPYYEVETYESLDTRDQYFEQCGRLIIEKEKGSIGILQRNFKIGFNRAARILDQLETAGVIGPEDGTKPRKVLMTIDEFERYISEGVSEKITDAKKLSEKNQPHENETPNISLRQHDFLQGTEYIIGIDNNSVIVNDKAKKTENIYTIGGDQVKELILKKGGVFGKGSIVIVCYSGDEININYESRMSSMFRGFMKQLSIDTGKPLIEI